MILGQEEKPSLGEVLEHHGVKGQKWGVRRRSEAEGGPSLSSVKARTDHPLAPLRSKHDQARAERIASGQTRRGAKAAVQLQTAKEREDFYQNKAQNIIDVASKDHESLIALKTGNGQHLIVTGKQFIDHMTAGGLMDIKASDVYATRDRTPSGKRTGPYILNPDINKPFVPSTK